VNNSDWVTTKALFRREHFRQAAKTTRKVVIPSWTETMSMMGSLTGETKQVQVVTPDVRFAAQLDLQIRPYRAPATRKRKAHTEHRLIVPPYLMRNSGSNGKRGSVLYVAARSMVEVMFGGGGGWTHTTAPPDEVVEVVLPDGRPVCQEPWLTRVVGRQWLRVVGPRADLVQHPGSHGYRPGRSRITAFEHYRKVFSTHRFVITKDVKDFYPSLRLELVAHVVAELLPELSPDLRNLGIWFHTAPIWRRPSHPARAVGGGPMRVEAPGHLLPGSTTAPLLSNLVADYVVGWPLEFKLGSEVVLIRYADDLLIMGTSADAAINAVAEVVRLLARADICLHPDKGLKEPVDVSRTPVEWLGKTLHGRSVRTSDESVRLYISELLDLDPGSVEFRQRVHSVLQELALDGEERVAFVVRRLSAACREHGHAFVQVGRGGVGQSGAAGDDYELEAAAAAEEDL
jgi:hypothetical protein